MLIYLLGTIMKMQDSARPAAYPLDSTDVVAIYGTSVYGTPTYGGASQPSS
jgi:hypothetical protein